MYAIPVFSLLSQNRLELWQGSGVSVGPTAAFDVAGHGPFQK